MASEGAARGMAGDWLTGRGLVGDRLAAYLCLGRTGALPVTETDSIVAASGALVLPLHLLPMTLACEKDRYRTGNDDGLEPLSLLDPDESRSVEEPARARDIPPSAAAGAGNTADMFESEGDRFAGSFANATIAQPLVVPVVIERLEKEPA